MFECLGDFFNCLQDEGKREAVNALYMMATGLGTALVFFIAWIFQQRKKNNKTEHGVSASNGGVANSGTIAGSVTTNSTEDCDK